MSTSVFFSALFFIILGSLLAVVGILALMRFASLHSKGTPVIARPLPAADGSGWRHGVMVYSESVLRVYKLRSLRPGSDVKFRRHDITIDSRRDPTDIEAGFFEPTDRVIKISTSNHGEWELALDTSGDTALVAWVESSPSVRQTRELPTDIEKRFRSASSRERGYTR